MSLCGTACLTRPSSHRGFRRNPPALVGRFLRNRQSARRERIALQRYSASAQGFPVRDRLSYSTVLTPRVSEKPACTCRPVSPKPAISAARTNRTATLFGLGARCPCAGPPVLLDHPHTAGFGETRLHL